MRVPVAPLAVLTIALLAATLTSVPSGAADPAEAGSGAVQNERIVPITSGFARVGDAADREAYLARRQAILERQEQSPQERGMVAGTTFLLPYFRVDTTSGGGVTTLWAVRNPGASTISIAAEYYDVFGNLFSGELFSLGPNRTITRNLRDVGGLVPDLDGFSRGYAVISANESGYLGGDFFDVTVNQDFATGGRMVKLDETFNCALTDSRFGVGGIFSGGTLLTVWVASPNGSNPDTDDPTITYAVYDEPGDLVGVIEVYTSLMATQQPIGELLDLLVAPPAVGAVEVMFELGSGGGHTVATFSAEDRFSIGVEGECIVTFL